MKPDEVFDPNAEAELERTRSELAGVFGNYSREVLDELTPSAEHRAAMHKMMLGLVTEDVLARRRRAPIGSLFIARWNRFCDCWRELALNSLAFRLTSQFALALGVGLVLSIMTIASIDSGSRADDRLRFEMDDSLVPDLEVFELNIPREIDPDLPSSEIPAEDAAPKDDPFERHR